MTTRRVPSISRNARRPKTSRTRPREWQMSNLNRQTRCVLALAAYRDTDERANLIDLLADAMHLCHAEGYDFPAIIEIATEHFRTETVVEEGSLPCPTKFFGC